jgi:hypothetical protein
MERRVPDKILKQLDKWSFHTRVLRISHFLLVGVATICSVLVASRLSPSSYISLDWLAALAAISIGLINAFDLGSKSNMMRKAWRNLNAAVIWFEADDTVTVKQVVDVYKQGEEIIGDVKEAP